MVAPRPIGPAPKIITEAPGFGLVRFIACWATAIGSGNGRDVPGDVLGNHPDVPSGIGVLDLQKVGQPTEGATVARMPTLVRVHNHMVPDSNVLLPLGLPPRSPRPAHGLAGWRPPGGIPPRAMYIASEPQIPQALILIRTSREPISGTGVSTTSVVPGPVTTQDRIRLSSPVRTIAAR